MKKSVLCFLVLVMAIMIIGPVFAAKPNYYQITSNVTSIWNIPLTTHSQDTVIQNDNASNGVWVNLKNTTLTSCDYNTQGCYYLAPSSSLEVYDHSSEGIQLISNGASSVSVMITY